MSTRKALLRPDAVRTGLIGIHVVYIVLLASWAQGRLTGPSPADYASDFFPWLLASIVLFAGWALTRTGNRIPDLGLWFTGLSYPFLFGHAFQSVLKLETTLLWNPGTAFSQSTMFASSFYALCALHTFMIGCLLVARDGEGPATTSLEPDHEQARAGWLSLVIGAVAHLSSSLALVSATQSADSYSNYTAASSAGIIDDLGYLFVLGIALLVVSRTMSLTAERVLLGGSLVYYVAVMTLSGSRKESIFAIVTILLLALWGEGNRRHRLRSLLLAGAFGLVLLNLLYVIRETRFTLSEVVPAFIESLRDLAFVRELAGESLAEMGVTAYSVAGIVQTVPVIFPYEAGGTFLRALPSILPIGWLVGDFFDKAASTYVINRYLGLPVGGSMFGDLYWNFGLVGGAVAALLFGMGIGSLRSMLVTKRHHEALYFVMFFVLLVGVRAGFIEIVRGFAYVLIFHYLLRLIVRHQFSRRTGSLR